MEYDLRTSSHPRSPYVIVTMNPSKQIKIKLSSIEPSENGPALVKPSFLEVRKRLEWFDQNLYLVTNRAEVLKYLEGAE
jgi:hypothetical protein